QTSGIIGVHLWGRPCDTDAIGKVAAAHDLRVIYDAAHAIGCSHKGRMIGSFGDCEVFSFHATKFINSFEGGAIVTNDDSLARRLRLMRNFGFEGYDNVVYPGTNGKMTEICAAMGLTSLEAIDEIVDINRRNHFAYQKGLRGLPGISLAQFNHGERNNYQYVVVEVDENESGIGRDKLIEILHRNEVLARKYFWPGCHRMEPYRTSDPEAGRHLPQTIRVAERVVVLPTGQTIGEKQVDSITKIIRDAVNA
ncbi:MAG: DegT/DnrJ/EryC1/StrS family aminotransferase, partial [Gemmatimonadales bacterium]